MTEGEDNNDIATAVSKQIITISYNHWITPY